MEPEKVGGRGEAGADPGGKAAAIQDRATRTWVASVWHAEGPRWTVNRP